MTRAQRIVDEVRQLPTEERMDVLQGLVDLVAPALSPEQEQGLVDAIDESDRGDLVEGTAAFAKLRVLRIYHRARAPSDQHSPLIRRSDAYSSPVVRRKLFLTLVPPLRDRELAARNAESAFRVTRIEFTTRMCSSAPPAQSL